MVPPKIENKKSKRLERAALLDVKSSGGFFCKLQKTIKQVAHFWKYVFKQYYF